MFDNKEIEAYRKISAPADLREKVLSSCTEEMKPARNVSRMIRTVSTLAACLILVICFSVMALGHFSETEIFISGEMLTHENEKTLSASVTPATYEVRTLSPTVEVPITLTTKGNAKISVSNGVLCVLNRENGEVLATVSSGTVYETAKDAAFVWVVSADTEQKNFEMTVKRLFNTEIIKLTYEETTGEWMISQTK